MNNFDENLRRSQRLHVQQVFEGWELLGFETRNKYRIYDEEMQEVGFAAEVSTGILGAIFRQLLGHWKKFDIHFYDPNRKLQLKAHSPFRWFFKTLFLQDENGRLLGKVQQRFGIFRKNFDLHDGSGNVIATIRSPFFKFWTFEVESPHRTLGTIQKKWSGLLGEFFTDKDNYVVSYASTETETSIKAIMLATCLMIDIVYFEQKGQNSVLDFGD